jgi:methyl-accepting chemotaxis protein
MDPTLLILLVLFIGIVAVSLLLQSLAFWGMYRSIRQLSVRIEKLAADLTKTTDSLSSRTEDVLKTVRNFVEKLQGMQANLTATTEIVQRRVVELDAFLEETTEAARRQVVRIQSVVENASMRVEDTFETLERRVLTPINEVSAIVTGLRTGLDVLLRKRRRPGTPSRQDEEMFI